MTHLASLTVKRNLYKSYVPLVVNGVACHAMVDSGNLFKNVISKDFLLKLKLTLADLVPPTKLHNVGTAKEGERLKVLGRVKQPLHISVAGIPTKFKTRSYVLDGLAMAFNLSLIHI